MNFETKIFNACIWFIAVCILLAVLTSCSAAVDIPTTATAAPTATIAAKHWGNSPLTPSPTSVSCTVNAGALYLRSGAGMSYAVTRILHDGDLLQVIEPGKWLKVETSQHVKGWVYGRYCK